MTSTKQTGRIQGALAGLLLLGLVVGIPVVLLLGSGSPIPEQIPSTQDITGALLEPDDGSLFLSVLVYVVWAAWAVFTLSVVLDAWSRIRGRQVPSITGLGKSQRAAAGLVGAFAALFVGAPLATAATVEAPVAVHASAQQATAPTSTPTVGEQAAKKQTTIKKLVHYRVKPGDTLWDISEDVLGDPTKYPRIVRATQDTRQPDGKYLTNPDHIEPGWELNVPVTKTSAKQAKNPADPATMPTPPAHADEQVGAPPPTTGSQQNQRIPSRDNQHQAPADTPETPPPAPAEAAPAPAEISQDSSAADSQIDPVAEEDSAVLRTAGGVGAVLAAGVLGVLGAKRLNQRRRRRPGQQIPMPEGTLANTEHELAAVADPLTVQRVDQALRSLAKQCNQDDVPLPKVRLAKLNEATFDLFLTEPAKLPQPWAGTSDATVWTLAAEDADLAADQVSDIPAPYPSLVTIGQVTHAGEEAHLLVDLEHIGTLGMVGDTQATREVVNALTLELATSQWADDLQVTVVGALPDLAGTLMNGRVVYYPTAEVLLDQLHTRAEKDSQTLRDAETDLYQARAAGKLPGLWTPEVIVLATPLTADQRSKLGETLTQHPRSAVAAITDQDSLGEWKVNITDPDTAVLQPQDLTFVPQRLSAKDYDAILEKMEIAEEEPIPTVDEAAATPEPRIDELPEPATEQQPDEPREEDEAPETLVRTAPVVDLTEPEAEAEPAGQGEQSPPAPPLVSIPEVNILGEVEVVGASGPVESKKLTRLTEMCAYLVLNPRATMHNLNDAIWPGTRVKTNTRNTYVAKLRRWLGADPTGQPWLPRASAQDHYRLRPEVRSDWAQLKELIPDSVFAASNSDLEAALKLVKGKPFSGVRANRYGWADYLAQEIIITVTDIAVELGNRNLRDGQWRAADRAATIGQFVDQLFEPLWRIRLMAAHQSGNIDAALEGAKRVELLHAQYDLDMDEETENLIRRIRDTARTKQR